MIKVKGTNYIQLEFDDYKAIGVAQYEDALIKAYVPEADSMSREEALALAMERDATAAQRLEWDAQEEISYGK